MNDFYLKTSIVFFGTLLFISAYFIFFSVLIGGDWRLYINAGDFVNMASFGFISTALFVALSRISDARRNVSLLVALGLLTLIMVSVVSINRYAAVYPESGVGALFFYVGIMDFIVAGALPFGMSRMARIILKRA